jgi:hypothetical protein
MRTSQSSCLGNKMPYVLLGYLISGHAHLWIAEKISSLLAVIHVINKNLTVY